MKRLSLVGNSGAGKSTLARRLGAELGLTVHTVDKIYWMANWVLREQESYRKLHDKWLQSESWIIDGVGYWDELESRLKRSDLIVFLDVPVARCKQQALHRIEAEQYDANTDITKGCRYSAVKNLQVEVIEQFHNQTRVKLLHLLDSFAGEKVQILNSPEQLRFENT